LIHGSSGIRWLPYRLDFRLVKTLCDAEGRGGLGREAAVQRLLEHKQRLMEKRAAEMVAAFNPHAFRSFSISTPVLSIRRLVSRSGTFRFLYHDKNLTPFKKKSSLKFSTPCMSSNEEKSKIFFHNLKLDFKFGSKPPETLFEDPDRE